MFIAKDRTTRQARGSIFAAGRREVFLTVLGLLAIIAAAIAINAGLWRENTLGGDIKQIWQEGRQLLAGRDPYERILAGDMKTADKFVIYFPLFYLLGALVQKVGYSDFQSWINFWQPIFLGFNIGIGIEVAYALLRRRLFLGALLGALFWFFNRWTLYVTAVGQIDFVAIFFLFASLLLFDKHQIWSLLLLSLSLSIKQMGIFFVPLYLIWVWQSSSERRVGRVSVAALLIGSIPLAVSLPFIIWNGNAFFKSLLFSFTRNPENHFKVASLAELAYLYTSGGSVVLAKLLMYVLMAMVFVGAFMRKIPRFTSMMLVMAIFVDFNAVSFRQHLTWLAPLVPLVLCEVVWRSSAASPSDQVATETG